MQQSILELNAMRVWYYNFAIIRRVQDGQQGVTYLTKWSALWHYDIDFNLITNTQIWEGLNHW